LVRSTALPKENPLPFDLAAGSFMKPGCVFRFNYPSQPSKRCHVANNGWRGANDGHDVFGCALSF